MGSVVHNLEWTLPVSGIRAYVIDPFISISLLGVYAVGDPRQRRGFHDECRIRGWRRDRGLHRPCRESGQEGVGWRSGVSCNLCGLVSDEFARHWLDAGNSFHITFVSPGTCDDDAATVRVGSLALLGTRA